MPLKALFPCLVAALALACGGSSSDSAGPSQPGSGGTAGGPKLAWDQFAPGADELRQYSYVLYVDGTAVPLSGATCGTLATETLTAACTAPLPAMSAGQHTLEMAARITRDGVVFESARSAPIAYNAGGTATGSVTQGAQAEGSAGDQSPKATGERPYAVEPVVTGLDAPSALAELPDGRLLIAERGGVIRLAGAGGLSPEPAADLPDADPAADAAVSIAPAPDFAESRQVFVGYGALDAAGARSGRVVRYREAGGVLGEPAVVVDGLPAGLAAPRVTIGPDRRLYIVTSSGAAVEADAIGSYEGKVLRLALDGTVPADNPFSGSPVYSFGHLGRLAVAWEPVSGVAWFVEDEGAGTALGRVEAGRRGARLVELQTQGPASLAAFSAAAPAGWRGSLFLAAPGEQCLLQVAGLSVSPLAPAVERLFQGEFGRITLVLAAEDGLYFATSNGAARGDGLAGDVVYRVRGNPGSSPRRRESP
jgi:glucose/arabinose dehydrogenase